jgi:hypothetical protein
MPSTIDFGTQSHLDSICENEPRRLAMNATTPEEFVAWKQVTRRALAEILGIAGRIPPIDPWTKKIGEVDRGKYVEEKHALDVGEGQLAPMYMLKPKTDPPWRAVAVFHGHNPSVQWIPGNYPDEKTRTEAVAKHNDYAQALAEAGFLTVVMEQRGFGERVSKPGKDTGGSNTCRHLAMPYCSWDVP